MASSYSSSSPTSPVRPHATLTSQSEDEEEEDKIAHNSRLADTAAWVIPTIATIPLFFLLTYFLFVAKERGETPCYSAQAPNMNENDYLGCYEYTPLSYLVYAYLGVGLLWGLVLAYMIYFVPRHKALVRKYLTHGIEITGDIFFNNRVSWFGRRRLYGHVTYAHPTHNNKNKNNNKRFYAHVTGEVRIVEPYTREHAKLLHLPDMYLSAQPKEDLEIIHNLYEKHQPRIRYITAYATIWLVFTIIAPIYILFQIHDLSAIYEFQPEYDAGKRTTLVYLLFVFFITPVSSYAFAWFMWRRYEHWMTNNHKIVQADKKTSNQPNNKAQWLDDNYTQLNG